MRTSNNVAPLQLLVLKTSSMKACTTDHEHVDFLQHLALRTVLFGSLSPSLLYHEMIQSFNCLAIGISVKSCTRGTN